MQWILALFLLSPIANAQVLHYHPAAAEANLDGLVHGIVKKVNIGDDNSLQSDSIVGPDGKALIIPALELFKTAKDEFEEEAEEISKILSEVNSKTITWATWTWSIIGCLLVVSCGILPVVFLPEKSSDFLLSEDGQRRMNWLLSFAVGSLLADVFLHLLPEIWSNNNENTTAIGLWVLAGFLVCFVAEKVCESTEGSSNKLCAIINLACNVIDNFTHGLAVAGSFLVSTQFGFMTTFSVLLHEIPHEMIDFAILLRADYSRSQAFKAQLVTATGGVIGAIVALYLGNDLSDGFYWILPFTAGGFINIALSQLLPELNEETDIKQNLLQLLFISLGVATVAVVDSGLSV